MREPGQFISTGARDEEAVELLNRIFVQAARRGASDVHFEDGDEGCLVRLRLNGRLEELTRIESRVAASMEAKIRMKAKMPLSERRVPLDGRLFVGVDGRMVDVRVSVLPIRTGQSIVCRILDQANAARRLADIDMTAAVRRAIEAAIAEPDGLVLVTGPTGSGKTSTLYAMLNALNGVERKCVTVEDPVEYRLPLACQVNVGPGLGFAEALRAILRQDPDVILVGEVRDAETARIALSAAMTGHLVLSTLHANDAASTLTRLVDLGLDPFTLGTAVRAVIAQRLLRKLCTCAVREAPGEPERAWLDRHGLFEAPEGYRRPAGCPACGGSGQAGRVAVMEVIVADRPVRRAVDANDRRAIARAARDQPQYETLAQAGARLAAGGLTTLAEAMRAASEQDGEGAS
jgi:type II secretory ATPase GspE/PulE/Tfp pilus assembly ATPase PilB-like protein